MSPENSSRRRARSREDGVGSRTAVASAAVAVAIVAGGGWAVAHAGNDKTVDTGTAQSGTSQTTTSAPTHDPGSQSSSQDKNKSWSKACGRAATAAARAGVGALAPSELPPGWGLGSCHYSPATGWHLEVTVAGQTLSVDQRKGAVQPVLAAVLGAHRHQGKDVHAPGTGTWQSWTGPGGKNGLSRGLSSGGAVVSGKASVATLNQFAGVLMTYETAPNGNNGG